MAGCYFVRATFVCGILVGVLAGLVSCGNNLGQNSKPVRSGVQKFAAVFFGCQPLPSNIANVTCTNRIQKLTKGVDCSVKVPLGTKASFTCPGSTTVTTIQCKFPGKWNSKDVKCLPADLSTQSIANGTTNMINAAKNATSTAIGAASNITAGAVDATKNATSKAVDAAAGAVNATINATSEAVGAVAKTVTNVTDTAVATKPQVPAGYAPPIKGVNPMKGHKEGANGSSADLVCHEEGAELMELDNDQKREAVVVLLGTSTTSILVGGKCAADEKYYNRQGGEVIPNWCTGYYAEPTRPCLVYNMVNKCHQIDACQVARPFVCEVITTTPAGK